MPLPTGVTKQDIESICTYLMDKPDGATQSEISSVLGENPRTGQKPANCKLLGFIEEFDGGRMKITERGLRVVGKDEKRKAWSFLEAVSSFPAYGAVIVGAVNQGKRTLTASEVTSIWQDRFRSELSKTEQSRINQAACFFRLLEGAGLGRYIIGRRGQKTRFTFDKGKSGKFVNEGENKPSGPEGKVDMERADRCFGEGDLDGAIRDYSAIIRQKPDLIRALNNRGCVWQQQDEHEKAIADFDEAIRLEPDYSLAWVNRGICWDTMGNLDKAIAEFTEAIRLNREDVVPWYCRGTVWAKKGDYNKAIADYSEAIRLAPENAIPWTNRSIALKKKGERDKAESDHNEAIRLEPIRAKLWFDRGTYWPANTQPDKNIYDMAA